MRNQFWTLWVPVFIFCSLNCTAFAADDGTGLKSSIAVDIVGSHGSSNFLSTAPTDAPNPTDTRPLFVREAEATFYAPVDHLFDGNLSIAAHQENGGAQFELHEAYISSSKLIPRSRFRLGQFFLGFGRLNQFHRHDWPFISAPKVQTAFFGGKAAEGAADTGLEYSILLPTPLYLDLTLGVTDGWLFGHPDELGDSPLIPTHYARLVTYNDLPGGGGMQTGLNFVGRTDHDGDSKQTGGLDLTAKWKEGAKLRYLFQSEIWLQSHQDPNGAKDRTLGFYLYPQYEFDLPLQLGLRVDFFHVLKSNDPAPLMWVPTLSWKPSEFSTLRIAYDHQGSQNAFEFQAVFILGAHPAHDF